MLNFDYLFGILARPSEPGGEVMDAEEYNKAKKRNWGYVCFCPHCGQYDRHVVIEEDSNGFGWKVLQLECINCEMYWEIWVDKKEQVLKEAQ